MAEEKTAHVHNHTIFVWEVDAQLLEEFKSAYPNEQFNSSKFKTTDGALAIWRLYCYPNDKVIGLESCKLPATKPCIGVNCTLEITEVDYNESLGFTFKSDRNTWIRLNAFETEQLQNVSKMTIKCTVQETMRWNEQSNNAIWSITGDLLNRIKHSRYKQRFRSPIINAIGAEWYLRLYPNGWNNVGTAALDLLCYAIESNKEEITLSHYIEIEETFFYDTNINGKSIKLRNLIECGEPFELKEIQNLSEIVIYVKIWKPNSMSASHKEMILNKQKMMEMQKQLPEVKPLFDELRQLRKLEKNINEKQERMNKLENKEKENRMEINELRKLRTIVNQQQERIYKFEDEQKEYELEINELRKENEILKLNNIDKTKYESWNYQEIVHWIISLDAETFGCYEKVLMETLSEEEVIGEDLRGITGDDIKRWGIKKFKHIRLLFKHICDLTMDKPHNNQLQLNEGIEPPTAYI